MNVSEDRATTSASAPQTADGAVAACAAPDANEALKTGLTTGAAHNSGGAIVERHPLGLPPGSVRALLCLVVVTFIVVQTARGLGVGVVWNEALMIMLAHYFTTRRFVPLSPEIRSKLEAAGQIETDANPLYLPKHSVRILIMAAFAGLGVYLYRQGRLFESQALPVLVSVGAYLLGILFKGFLAWWSRLTGAVAPRWWVDLKAGATLAIVLAAVGLQMFAVPSVLGVDARRLEDFSLGLVLFYFGSR